MEKFVFTLPSILDHNHSLTIETCQKEPTDKRILRAIEYLVLNGITDTNRVKEKITEYIKEKLEINDAQLLRGRYNPSLKCIRNTIYSFCKKKGIKSSQETKASIATAINASNETMEYNLDNELYSENPLSSTLTHDIVDTEVEICLNDEGNKLDNFQLNKRVRKEEMDKNEIEESIETYNDSSLDFNDHETLTLTISNDLLEEQNPSFKLISNFEENLLDDIGQIPTTVASPNDVLYYLKYLQKLSKNLSNEELPKFVHDLKSIGLKWSKFDS